MTISCHPGPERLFADINFPSGYYEEEGSPPLLIQLQLLQIMESQAWFSTDD